MPTVQERVAASGVTREQIRAVMNAFYSRVRRDEILGPVFDKVVAEADWPAHLEKVARFWDLAFRLDHNYAAHGFMSAHMKHMHIREEQTRRWLQLFDESLGETCSEREAAAFRAIAQAMTENIRFGLQRRANRENAAR
jgi:hemoglobin